MELGAIDSSITLLVALELLVWNNDDDNDDKEVSSMACKEQKKMIYIYQKRMIFEKDRGARV